MSYIEREPLLEILNGLYDHHLTMRNYAADGATYDCIEAVIEAPTAEVVEVRHGEWKKVSEKYPRYVCTCCNHLYNNKEYKYCPYCGAKMDGERSENDTD